MRRRIGLVGVVGFFALLAAANAQAPPATTAFDGIYRLVSSTRLTATYVDRNGRTGP